MMNKHPANQRLQLILNSISQLRPMPTNTSRVLSVLNDPDSSARMLSEYIGLDQALSALIFKSANSAVLGYSRTCTTIQDAVTRLGFKRVRSLVMGSSAYGYKDRGLSGYRLGTGELWNHAVATAMAAEWLAHRLDYPEPEEAYAAGLLHDMGKLILDQYVFNDYTSIVEMMNRYKLNLWQAEQELLGIDHATVGSLIAEKWEFPLVLVDTIHFHHSPSMARTKPILPAIVNFANSVACRSSKSVLDLFNKMVHPETPGILHLDDFQVQNVETSLCKYMEQ
jgi:putative nucleotidyltransferase with HDIG domain